MSQEAVTDTNDTKRTDTVGDDFAKVNATFGGNVDDRFPIDRDRRENMTFMAAN